MTGTVNIGGIDVEMTANAATPYRFKQAFGLDFFQLSTEDLSDAQAVETYQKLGYIMAMQAKGADMSKLNEETFFAWLEQFDGNAMIEALTGVAAIYAGNTKQSVNPK